MGLVLLLFVGMGVMVLAAAVIEAVTDDDVMPGWLSRLL